MKMIAVILSGGQSRRMGRDKALLEFDGKPMLRHLVELYRPWFDGVYVSVNQAGRFDTAGAGEIVDRRPGIGPLAALESIFLETDAEIAFLTATDLPFGDPETARQLAEGCRSTTRVCSLPMSRCLRPTDAAAWGPLPGRWTTTTAACAAWSGRWTG